MIPGASASDARRGHRSLPHTADAGLEATGPDLAAVFEEAAYALAEETADIAPEALLALDASTLPRPQPIRLVAADLAGLAYAWLAELVGRIDVDGAIAAVEVESVTERSSDRHQGQGRTDQWSLRARVATLPFDSAGVRRRTEVKAVTYHELAVQPTAGGWRLTAYLDI